MIDSPSAPPSVPILVTKASGDQVPFESAKLRESLSRAGASPQLIDEITHEIEGILVSGISTRKIYQKAFSLLRKKQRPVAARYKLKRAIMELGPSGYPFEVLFGEVMKEQGYKVRVGTMMQGHCITHEVDVLAESEQKRIMVECKYGNKAGKKVNSQVSMYVLSRFNDLSSEWEKDKQYASKQHEGWIATNTMFTEEAIKFAECMGIRLISWNYPHTGNLREMIDRCRLYPVTALTVLTKKEKQALLAQNVVLCRDLARNPKLLEALHLSTGRMKRAMQEIETVCV